VTGHGIEIRVVAHAGLSPRGDGSCAGDVVTVAAGTTLAGVLESLRIDRGVVGIARVGGRIVQLDARLLEDVVVDVYPVFGGG
jgi:hypothetical protein